MKPSNSMIAFVPLLMSLILAVRALRSRSSSFEKMAGMAIIWILIIISMSFFAARLAG